MAALISAFGGQRTTGMDSDFSGSSSFLKRLDSMGAGDEQARAELIEHAQDRLRQLGRRMLQGLAGDPRRAPTDEVLLPALARLHKALAESSPCDKQHFLRLSTMQIRQGLLDLVKHYQGSEGIGANLYSLIHVRDGDSNLGSGGDAIAAEGPQSFEDWTEFHECVTRMPDDEKEVFELLWYQGLTLVEAADILGVTERMVRRQWISSRLRLSSMLGEKA